MFCMRVNLAINHRNDGIGIFLMDFDLSCIVVGSRHLYLTADDGGVSARNEFSQTKQLLMPTFIWHSM